METVWPFVISRHLLFSKQQVLYPPTSTRMVPYNAFIMEQVWFDIVKIIVWNKIATFKLSAPGETTNAQSLQTSIAIKFCWTKLFLKYAYPHQVTMHSTKYGGILLVTLQTVMNSLPTSPCHFAAETVDKFSRFFSLSHIAYIIS